MARDSRTAATNGLSVTALGTGASSLDNGRASVGYAINVDGEPRLLVDAGGGTAARLSEAGTDLTSLEAVFFAHLHIDHTADFPAVVKAAAQQGRGDRPLAVYGPAGSEEFPGTAAFVARLFDPADGAYGYLPGFLERYADAELTFDVTEIDAAVGEADRARTVHERDGLTVAAIPVVHGRIPSLAYRIDYGDESVTLSGDYASETGNVAELGDGTDVLVHHRLLEAGSESEGPKRELHSTPAECGATASDADAGALVLSHVGRDDPDDLDAELECVREAYDGPVTVARDLVDVYPDGTVEDIRRDAEPEIRSLPGDDGDGT